MNYDRLVCRIQKLRPASPQSQTSELSRHTPAPAPRARRRRDVPLVVFWLSSASNFYRVCAVSTMDNVLDLVQLVIQSNIDVSLFTPVTQRQTRSQRRAARERTAFMRFSRFRQSQTQRIGNRCSENTQMKLQCVHSRFTVQRQRSKRQRVEYTVLQRRLMQSILHPESPLQLTTFQSVTPPPAGTS
jgi:hypothetical protein